MMGSHVNYASRVPEAFRRFSSTEDIPPRPWRRGRAMGYINDYDNSILYGDTVLADIIELLRTVPNACFLYFSDHGEEVFDTLPQHGHVHELRSRHYLDIPFFIWLSPGYRGLAGSRPRPTLGGGERQTFHERRRRLHHDGTGRDMSAGRSLRRPKSSVRFVSAQPAYALRGELRRTLCRGTRTDGTDILNRPKA